MAIKSFAARLLEHNDQYVDTFDLGELKSEPSLQVAILTCMDARIDTAKLLGVSEGQAHVIRNAGGVLTDDALRSLIISQHYLGTREIIVIQHTDCGMMKFRSEDLSSALEASTGVNPEMDFHTFDNLRDEILLSVSKIKACPFLVERNFVSGYVYDVHSGLLQEQTRKDD